MVCLILKITWGTEATEATTTETLRWTTAATWRNIALSR
jgi:hypothetical protein